MIYRVHISSDDIDIYIIIICLQENKAFDKALDYMAAAKITGEIKGIERII